MVIVALAGRRVDLTGQVPSRFPAGNINLVRDRIRAVFISLGASVLVCSAAAGADLIALQEAAKLGMRRVVVLPFQRERFRASSVADRAGCWSAAYDTVMEEVEHRNDVVISPKVNKDRAYVEANHLIVIRALAIAKGLEEPVVAIQVWEGGSRGDHDVTEEFGFYAAESGIHVISVLTS